MAGAYRPRRWGRTKPPGNARVITGHPLANRLRLAWLLNGTFRETLTGEMPSNTPSQAWVMTPWGLAMDSANVSTKPQYTTAGILNRFPITGGDGRSQMSAMAVVHSPHVSGSSQAILGVDLPVQYAGLRAEGFQDTSQVSVQFGGDPTGGASMTPTLGLPAVYYWRWRDGDSNEWVTSAGIANAAVNHSGAFAGTSNNPHTSAPTNLYLGRTHANGDHLGYPLATLLIWDRRLTDAEIDALHREPWQMFESASPKYYATISELGPDRTVYAEPIVGSGAVQTPQVHGDKFVTGLTTFVASGGVQAPVARSTATPAVVTATGTAQSANPVNGIFVYPATVVATGTVQAAAPTAKPTPSTITATGAVSSVGASYSSVVLADSPAGYWRLGGNANDSSGNAQHGTNTGTPSTVAGLVAGDDAYSLAGTMADQDGVNLPSGFGPTSATGAYTFECWVQTTDTTGPLVSIRHSSDAGNSVYTLCLGHNGAENHGNGKVGFLVRDQNRNGLTYTTASGLSSAAAINDGNKHHVVWVRNSSKQHTIYVDGSVYFTGETDGMTAGVLSDTAAIGKERLWISSSYLTENDRFLTGVVDEVALYNTALSSTRVQDHYTAGINGATTLHAIATPGVVSGTGSVQAPTVDTGTSGTTVNPSVHVATGSVQTPVSSASATPATFVATAGVEAPGARSTAFPAAIVALGAVQSATVQAGTQITLDAVTAPTGATLQTSATHALGYGSGNNRLALVAIHIEGNGSPGNITSLTFNGAAMTHAGRATQGHSTVDIYYLPDSSLPASAGSYTVSLTTTNTLAHGIGVISLKDAGQGAPVFASSGVASSPNISTNITTAADNSWVIDACTNNGDSNSYTPGGSQVERYDLDVGGGGGLRSAMSSLPVTSAGSTSVSQTCTNSPAVLRIAQAVVAVSPATSGTTVSATTISATGSVQTPVSSASATPATFVATAGVEAPGARSTAFPAAIVALGAVQSSTPFVSEVTPEELRQVLGPRWFRREEMTKAATDLPRPPLPHDVFFGVTVETPPTPETIVATGAVQTSTQLATATPAVVLATGLVQAATLRTTAAPAVFTADGTIQSVIAEARVFPSLVLATGAVQGASVQTEATTTVTPATITALGAVQAVTGLARAFPGVFLATGAVQSPATVVRALPTVISATGLVQAPSQLDRVLPAAIVATGLVQSPTSLAIAFPSAVLATGSVQAASVTTAGTPTPATIVGLGVVQAPSPSVRVFAQTLTGTGFVLTPAGNVITRPTTLLGFGQVQVPEINLGLFVGDSFTGSEAHLIGSVLVSADELTGSEASSLAAWLTSAQSAAVLDALLTLVGSVRYSRVLPMEARTWEMGNGVKPMTET